MKSILALSLMLVVGSLNLVASQGAQDPYLDENFNAEKSYDYKWQAPKGNMDPDGVHPAFPVPQAEEKCVDTQDPHDEPCPSKSVKPQPKKPKPIYNNTNMNDRTWYKGFCQQNTICLSQGGQAYQEEVIQIITEMCSDSSLANRVRIIDIEREFDIPDHVYFYRVSFRGEGDLGGFTGQVVHEKNSYDNSSPKLLQVNLNSGKCK